MGLWQSSPLTLFFHAQRVYQGSQENLVSNAASLNNADAMQKAASLLMARIQLHARGIIEIYSKASVSEASREDIELMPRDSLEVNSAGHED